MIRTFVFLPLLLCALSVPAPGHSECLAGSAEARISDVIATIDGHAIRYGDVLSGGEAFLRALHSREREILVAAEREWKRLAQHSLLTKAAAIAEVRIPTDHPRFSGREFDEDVIAGLVTRVLRQYAAAKDVARGGSIEDALHPDRELHLRRDILERMVETERRYPGALDAFSALMTVDRERERRRRNIESAILSEMLEVWLQAEATRRGVSRDEVSRWLEERVASTVTLCDPRFPLPALEIGTEPTL